MGSAAFETLSRERGFLVVAAGGVLLAIWAWWTRSPTKLAQDIRQNDSPVWWVALAAVLLVTLALGRC